MKKALMGRRIASHQRRKNVSGSEKDISLHKTIKRTHGRTDRLTFTTSYRDARSHLNRRTPPSRYPQKKIKRTILRTQNLSSRRYRNSKTRSGEILPKQIF